MATSKDNNCWQMWFVRVCCPSCVLAFVCFALACPTLCVSCPVELHVLDGVAQTIFVRANYSMEVRGGGSSRSDSSSSASDSSSGRSSSQSDSCRSESDSNSSCGPSLFAHGRSRHCQNALGQNTPTTTLCVPPLPPPPHTQHPPVVQTSDAERIGVDQVAKILASGKATGTEQRECGAAQQPEAEAVLTGVWWALQQPDSACRGVLGRQACKAWSDSRVTPGGGCSAL